MVHETTAEDFYEAHAGLPLIDVRSPVEFNKGHIPGAFNIFLFNDDERALLGYLYTQKSPEEAINKGKELANSRLERYVASALELAPSKVIRVYCFRGGLRSHSFADLLSSHGFEVYLLDGGYKAFRNLVLPAFFHCPSIIVLGGTTGSGKTEMLHRLAERGVQVLDLEGLANHKGSVFGGMSEQAQPSTQQFENLLFEKWSALDFSKPVLVEDENHDIGSVKVPHSFWMHIRNAPMIRLEVPREERLKLLLEVYAGKQDDLLIRGVWRIEQRLGNLQARQSEKAILEGNYRLAAEILLDYYDKYYTTSIEKRNRTKVFPINISGKQTLQDVESLLSLINVVHQKFHHQNSR